MINLRLIGLILAKTIILLSLFYPAGPVKAQDMRPLQDVIGQATTSYPFVRCAGMYQAFLSWAGEQRLGTERFEAFEGAVENLYAMSVLINVDEGLGTETEASDVVVRDITNVMNLYLERFKKNYAAVGQAFGEDEMVLSDMKLCQVISDSLS